MPEKVNSVRKLQTFLLLVRENSDDEEYKYVAMIRGKDEKQCKEIFARKLLDNGSVEELFNTFEFLFVKINFADVSTNTSGMFAFQELEDC